MSIDWPYLGDLFATENLLPPFALIGREFGDATEHEEPPFALTAHNHSTHFGDRNQTMRKMAPWGTSLNAVFSGCE